MSKNAKKVSLYGMLLALSMVLSYVEAMIPVNIGIPGVKLGLPNIVTVLGLFTAGTIPTLLIGVLRILLVSFLFGNTMTLMYSFSGFFLSIFVMLLLKKIGISHVVLSIAGGCAHNTGQLLAAAWLLHSSQLAFYYPVLFAAGIAAGFAIGILSGILLKRLSGPIRHYLDGSLSYPFHEK